MRNFVLFPNSNKFSLTFIYLSFVYVIDFEEQKNPRDSKPQNKTIILIYVTNCYL